MALKRTAQIAQLLSITLLFRQWTQALLSRPHSFCSSVRLKNSLVSQDISFQGGEADSARLFSTRKQTNDLGREWRAGADGANSRRASQIANTVEPGKVRHHLKKKLRSRKKTKEPTKSTKRIDLPYELTIEALRTYESKHSNLVLPRRFVVPDSQDYPEELRGVDLATAVYDMTWWQKHVKQQPDRVAELNKLGFVWERLQPEWNLVLEAMITYSSLNGDLLVPNKFVVPYGDDAWPKATWGISLGNCVYRIRIRSDFLRGSTSWSRREQLDALGFVWDLQEHRFRIFYEALLAFSRYELRRGGVRQRSALRVPTCFVIPSTAEWPRDLWGYKLGEKCVAVRQKGLYVKDNQERLQLLADIGFHAGGNASLGWLEVVHAAAVYSQMKKHLDVPARFVVPAPPQRMETSAEHQVIGSDDAWPWPEYLWGFPLGQRLKDVRLKNAYLKGPSAGARKRQLDALGFNWNPKRGRKPNAKG